MDGGIELANLKGEGDALNTDVTHRGDEWSVGGIRQVLDQDFELSERLDEVSSWKQEENRRKMSKVSRRTTSVM